MSFGLIANLMPLATFAATIPAIDRAWGLDASEAGWIGGIYFAGYALAVPILASATDRLDACRIFIASSLLGAAASFAFAAADGFWSGLCLRFLSGVALAGVQMPGLKLLADRAAGRARARGSAIYTSCYALGAAGSFLLAGVAEGTTGWRSTFIVSGIGPLLALAAVTLLPPPLPCAPASAPRLDFRPILRNRALMAYVLAFAGNTWEVFAVRVWFVAYLTWILGLPGNSLALPPPAVISGLASLVGFPVNIAVAELALRRGRWMIIATCIVSVLVCVALAATAGGPVRLVLPLLVLVQVTSIGDVGALTSGAVEAADAARRGAALAVYAFTGYVTAFAGPVVAGIALDRFGGVGSSTGWSAAFATIALGSAVAACAVGAARPRRDRA
jgi:MFS family permease